MIKVIAVLNLILVSGLCAQNIEPMVNINSPEVNKALKYYTNAEFEKSKKHLLEIIESESENTEAYYLLSIVHYKLDELDKAIEKAEYAVEIENNHAMYHYNLAQLYVVDAKTASIFRTPGLISSIIEELETTIKLDSNHTKAIYDLGYVYSDIPGILGGDTNKANQLANKLLLLDEKYARFLLSKIHSDNDELKKEEEEYKLLEEKFGNDKEIYRFYNSYGYLLLNQGRLDEAIQKFKKQVELAPDDWRVFDSLGEAYLVNGEDEPALLNYKKSLELNPTNQNAINVLSKFENE